MAKIPDKIKKDREIGTTISGSDFIVPLIIIVILIILCIAYVLTEKQVEKQSVSQSVIYSDLETKFKSSISYLGFGIILILILILIFKNLKSNNGKNNRNKKIK